MGWGRNQNISSAFLSYEVKAYNHAWAWYYWNFKVLDPDYQVWSFEDLVSSGFNLGFRDPAPSIFD